MPGSPLGGGGASGPAGGGVPGGASGAAGSATPSIVPVAQPKTVRHRNVHLRTAPTYTTSAPQYVAEQSTPRYIKRRHELQDRTPDVPWLFRPPRPRGGEELLARPGQRPHPHVHQRRDGPVQG